MTIVRRPLLFLALAGGLVALGACGSTVTTTETLPSTTTLAPPNTAPSTTTTTTATPTGPTATLPEVTPTTIPATLQIDDDWDGELIEFGPRNGDALMVVGVRYNDVLNVREGPGVEFPSVTTLAPDATGFSALGMTWLNTDSAWLGIDIDGVQGWASFAFLSQHGGMVGYLPVNIDWGGGDPPTSGSLIDLGRMVAETFASDEPPSRIEQPANVILGAGTGEVTFDVLDLGDDSVAGLRLRVIAEDMNGTWHIVRVEATILCSRGVSEGRCV